jgi:hypothetical protein
VARSVEVGELADVVYVKVLLGLADLTAFGEESVDELVAPCTRLPMTSIFACQAQGASQVALASPSMQRTRFRTPAATSARAPAIVLLPVPPLPLTKTLRHESGADTGALRLSGISATCSW